MRINKFIALATGISRRKVDELLLAGKARVNGRLAKVGQLVNPDDKVELGDLLITVESKKTTIKLHKPAGYVVSRSGQGSKTIYDLLAPEYQNLKPAGRLDKDSSGLLLLTNDGQLAYELTHPKFNKQKIYEVSLNKNLSTVDESKIRQGIKLEDGLSKLGLKNNGLRSEWVVIISEGRNRQIRRTFSALGYGLNKLHRVQFGPYRLGQLEKGQTEVVLT